jgi:hypothetical protein
LVGQDLAFPEIISGLREWHQPPPIIESLEISIVKTTRWFSCNHIAPGRNQIIKQLKGKNQEEWKNSEDSANFNMKNGKGKQMGKIPQKSICKMRKRKRNEIASGNQLWFLSITATTAKKKEVKKWGELRKNQLEI